MSLFLGPLLPIDGRLQVADGDLGYSLTDQGFDDDLPSAELYDCTSEGAI